MNPTQLILLNIDDVLNAVAQCDGNFDKAYKLLFKNKAELTKAMTDATFKAVAPIVLETHHQLTGEGSLLAQVLTGYDAALTLVNTVNNNSVNEVNTVNNEVNNAVYNTVDCQNNGVNMDTTQVNNAVNTVNNAIYTEFTEFPQTLIDMVNKIVDARIEVLNQSKPKVNLVTDSSGKPKVERDRRNQFHGWSIVYQNGYYKLFKKVDGKTVGIHVGREWDINVATKKLAAKGYSIDQSTPNGQRLS